MPRITRHTTLQHQSFSIYDDIIDVRSSSEFAEDHIPGAINLPVLSDEERAEVGTIYVQDSRFRARRRGAALVSANISRHLQTFLVDKSADYRPIIYCWRGGMRSAAMATVLSEVGWSVAVLDRGYKAWRRRAVSVLREDPAPMKILLLDGQTGTAKTDILRALAGGGCQTLDLEDCAKHRGSVFGQHGVHPQPTQKFFESLLLSALDQLDLQRHIVVEAESNMIGKRLIPDRLANAMRSAPRIEIHADLQTRARYLVQVYSEFKKDAERLEASINALQPFHSRGTIERWLKLATEMKGEQLAAEIAEHHYDPLYSRQRHDQPVLKVCAPTLDSAGITSTADKIAAFVAALDNEIK